MIQLQASPSTTRMIVRYHHTRRTWTRSTWRLSGLNFQVKVCSSWNFQIHSAQISEATRHAETSILRFRCVRSLDGEVCPSPVLQAAAVFDRSPCQSHPVTASASYLWSSKWWHDASVLTATVAEKQNLSLIWRAANLCFYAADSCCTGADRNCNPMTIVLERVLAMQPLYVAPSLETSRRSGRRR